MPGLIKKIHIRGAFRRMSLVQKFSAAVVFLIFTVMVMVNTLIITHQRRAFKAEMEGNHRVLAEKLARDVMELLIFVDPLRLDKLVRTTAQTPACTYAVIVDKKMRIVAHTSRKLLGQTASGEMQRQISLAVERREGTVGEISGEGIREIIIPVAADYEVVGAVVVGFSNDAIEAVIDTNLQGLKKYILLISFLIMGMGIGIAYVLARFLTTPIQKLKGKMELVQAGSLDVDTSDEHLVPCHDLFGCGLKECPAYGRKRCWTIPGTLCCGTQGDPYQKMCECRRCLVYKDSCGDEIGELVEVFHQMITRLRDSIRELEESNKEKTRLERLSALGEMSMTVAHEIKNPLNAIRGAASYLKNNFEGEVLQEFLSIIEEETRRLNEIVTSILRYSRPVPLKVQLSDLNKVVRDTVELVRQEAMENDVEMALSLDERIPSFSFDAQQLKQAFLNILVNSLDVTGAGDTIRISTELVDSRVRVAIRDTGAGISEEALSEIFKPFFTTKTRGSGLGLACVERIVKDHKGDISVTSTVGTGTEFTISLPLWK
ncbi:MAG: sensor histidine kinase [Alphaproteobacteria bacterium]|uniref:histidine kinase n=1 Tax=Candidatus Nitrobium versatile TaxID=2884831 RepID=A0A953J3C6_9BACT|nr:sensor histidine kinase [Candidatus Nitrobium versatile]